MSQPKLQFSHQVQNRQLLQGRLAAAKWLSLSEPEVAREFVEVESDPVFQELLTGAEGRSPVILRKRWPASRLSPGFYELKEDFASGSGPADIQDLTEKHADLLVLIRKIGQEAFERYFLYGEEGLPLSKVCRTLGLTEEEGKRILSLVLEVGTRSEFFHPATASQVAGVAYHCIARIERDPRDPGSVYFQFLTAQWARGKYEVSYERLESWKKERKPGPQERKRLRGLLKKIELLNMRQDTLFQILSRATTAQAAFLRSRQDHLHRPLSLRELARRLGVAPSTVSRAVGSRSVILPWGEEAPLKSLLTGQRRVVLSLLAHWKQAGELGPKVTDEKLMRRLADEAGVSVSRRTVNECRHRLEP